MTHLQIPFTLSNSAWILFVILLVVTAVWYLRKSIFNYLKHRTSKLEKKISNEIRSSVKPHFIELSPDTQNIVHLANDIWKLEQRLKNIEQHIPKDDRQKFDSSIERLKRYLEKNDIETKDYTEQKYNDGLNVEVLSVEKDESISGQIVKETVNPAIFHKGQIIKKASVIITSK